MTFSKVAEVIDGYGDEVIELERRLVAIPALSPDYDAAADQTGEAKKVDFLVSYLREHGIDDLQILESPDDRVPGGVRPNLVARIKGRSSERTVWVMAHTDIVPPGDLEKWHSDPYELRVEGDRIYGRGVEDNHQGLVAGVLAARAMIETNSVPAYDFAMLFVADEEVGSVHGIQYVLESANLFKANDIIVVPDGGAADGSEIEVAEKSIAWVRFKLEGKQCHGSVPAQGINAMRAGAHMIVRLDKALHESFDREDPLFEPPQSTFEPTKKEANVSAVNIIPGDEVFYFDCRVLPCYQLEEVISKMEVVCNEVAAEFGVKFSMSFDQKEDAAPPTPVDAPVVGMLKDALKEVYGVEGRPVGIGGGTVAAYLRREGLHCVVWSKMEETMHAPNECARISNILGDAKVLAHVTLSQ